VQIDTASGVVNDIPGIRKAVDSAGHSALFLVDVIASLGCMAFKMDEWGVDVAIAGAQKGLMTPPGLSFNAAGAKALAAHERADLTTHYWDWTARQGPEHYQKYCGTPPEHLMFALRQALDMLLAEGLENVFLRHKLLAEATRQAVEAWGTGGAMELNIIAPDARANSVTTVLLDEKYIVPLLDYAREKCNVVLGIGIGAYAGKAFRIAHMGYANAPMLLGTLGVIEMGLSALGVPHGKGVQAAIDTLARNVPAAAQKSNADTSDSTDARSCAGQTCC
jgi:alanine-glyoxylate transaminase/serine-glyoxylate transaminase/serine-pyruvate transaminase